MKMAIAFAVGLLILLAVVLFCVPVRQRAEAVLFGDDSRTAGPRQAPNPQPLSDAAETAQEVLKGAWERAADAVGKSTDEGESPPPASPEEPLREPSEAAAAAGEASGP